MKRLLLFLLPLCVLGSFTILYAVPKTSGGVWDSVVYIGVARNIATGHGFYLAHSLPKRSFSHWAPLYPLLLSVPAYFGVDPAESGKWFSAIGFGSSILLAGIITWRFCGKSLLFGILASVMVLTSPDVINIVSQVLSEDLFIPLLLGSLLLMLIYKGSGRPGALLGAAAALGAALATRYAGDFFLIASILILFSLQDLRRKPRLVAGFLFISVLPSALWILRNHLSGGTTVGNRQLTYHGVSHAEFHDVLHNLMTWFAPESAAHKLRFLVALALIAIVVGAYVVATRKGFRSSDSRQRSTVTLVESCLVFGLVYLGLLFMTMCFLDASERPDQRYLCVIFPIAAIAITGSLALWREILGARSITWVVMLAGFVTLLGGNTLRSVSLAANIRKNGTGFQTEQWQDPVTAKVVNALPAGVMAYSDNPTLIYFLTRRPLYFVPTKLDSGTLRENPDFEDELLKLEGLGNVRPVVIVIFKQAQSFSYYAVASDFEQHGFRSAYRSPKGTYFLCSSAAMRQNDLLGCTAKP